MPQRSPIWPVRLLAGPFVLLSLALQLCAAEFRAAVFSIDVTIPLGHRCMGVLPIKAKEVADPLFAKGFVLLGGEKPVVVAAVDWCEIRNGSYDAWRDTLATAAGTSRQHVILSSIHQHDAPVVDAGAQSLLNAVGLKSELFDEEFHAACLERVAKSVRVSLNNTQPVTHVGIGQAKVDKVASSRRVVEESGRVQFGRSSGSGGDAFFAGAPEGQIDPMLKTLSLWNDDRPVVALHVYAVHPMSNYGQGSVSADFVGLARRLHAADHPDVLQMYASGCSGDVTAGKYNDRSPGMREVLADRLYQAMQSAWATTEKHPLQSIALRTTELQLTFREGTTFEPPALNNVITDQSGTTESRILAAMTLSSRNRVQQPIDFPCLDFGPAQVVLFPGEAFVAYQLMAQRMRPDSFVVSIGYGECWPGYIPTDKDFDEGFTDQWLWVSRGSEQQVQRALKRVLFQ